VYVGAEVRTYAILISAVYRDEGGFTVSRYGPSIHKKSTPDALCIGGWVGPSIGLNMAAKGKLLLAVGNPTPTFQLFRVVLLTAPSLPIKYYSSLTNETHNIAPWDTLLFPTSWTAMQAMGPHKAVALYSRGNRFESHVMYQFPHSKSLPALYHLIRGYITSKAKRTPLKYWNQPIFLLKRGFSFYLTQIMLAIHQSNLFYYKGPENHSRVLEGCIFLSNMHIKVRAYSNQI
jgi:hypothetical protein